MYAWVKVTRNGKPFGEGWWDDEAKLELNALPDPDEEWMLEELDLAITPECLYRGRTAEVRDNLTGTFYEIEVEKVYLNYNETLDLLPNAEETVILEEITGSTTDEELRIRVEDCVRVIREGTESEPNKRAIEWWYRLVRDTARDLDKNWDNDDDYWSYDPDPLEIEVARGLARLRKAKEG